MRSLNTQRSATIRCFFFFNDTATTEIYTLSLHDALPIYIYPDVGAIQRQFHHLVRIVPGGGRIVWNAADALLRDTLQMGCWTPLEGFAREPRTDALWSARAVHGVQDFSRFEILEGGQPRGTVQWSLIGAHNVENALAAIAAARHVGVEVRQALDALQAFQGIARRLQLYGEVNRIRG